MLELDLNSEVVSNNGFKVLIQMAQGNLPNVLITFFKTKDNETLISNIKDRFILYYREIYIFDVFIKSITYDNYQNLIVSGIGMYSYFDEVLDIDLKKGEKINNKYIKADYDLKVRIRVVGRLVDVMGNIALGRSYYYLSDAVYIDKSKYIPELDFGFTNLNFSLQRKLPNEYLNEDKFKCLVGYKFKTALNYLIIPGIKNFFLNEERKEVYYIVDRVTHFFQSNGTGQSYGFFKNGVLLILWIMDV